MTVQSQDRTFSGTLSFNGTALEFATVQVRNSLDSSFVAGATSDINGKFTIEKLPATHCYAIIQSLGYQKHVIQVDLGQGSVRNKTIGLEEESIALNQVEIFAFRPAIEKNGDKTIVEVQNSPRNAGADALTILSNVPGLQVDQNDQISIEGRTGVSIMVNGKVLKLPPGEGANYLRSLNSATIATIELLQSAGADQDAAGSAGTINIITKKQQNDGWNLTATSGIGYGRYPKLPVSVMANIRRNKASLNVGYNYSYNKRWIDVTIDRSIQNERGILYFDQLNEQEETRKNHMVTLGSDINLGKKTALAIAGNYGWNSRAMDIDNRTDIFSAIGEANDSSVLVSNLLASKWRTIDGSVGVKHNFSTHQQLTLEADYFNYDFRQHDRIHIETTYPEAASASYSLRSDIPSEINIASARIAYSQAIGAGTIDVGARLSTVTTNNMVGYSTNYGGTWLPDEVRTADFDYTENIRAAYADYKVKYKDTDVQLGLRMEQTDYEGTSVLKNASFNRSYTKLFPSMRLSKQLGQYATTLTYNRKIDRPVYNDLYPFIFFLDPFSSARGNPALQPQFADVLRLTVLKDDYALTLAYNRTTSFMAFVIRQDNETYVGYSTRENFSNFGNYSLNFSAPFTIRNWWQLNANTNIYLNQYNTQFLDASYRVQNVTGQLVVTNSLKLPLNLTAEIGGIYNAPGVVSIFKRRGYGVVNVGLQRTFLDKKLRMAANFSDVLLSTIIANRVKYQNLDLALTQRYETRVFRMSLSYSLGNSSASSKKVSASEDERRRIGNN